MNVCYPATPSPVVYRDGGEDLSLFDLAYPSAADAPSNGGAFPPRPDPGLGQAILLEAASPFPPSPSSPGQLLLQGKQQPAELIYEQFMHTGVCAWDADWLTQSMALPCPEGQLLNDFLSPPFPPDCLTPLPPPPSSSSCPPSPALLPTSPGFHLFPSPSPSPHSSYPSTPSHVTSTDSSFPSSPSPSSSLTEGTGSGVTFEAVLSSLYDAADKLSPVEPYPLSLQSPGSLGESPCSLPPIVDSSCSLLPIVESPGSFLPPVDCSMSPCPLVMDASLPGCSSSVLPSPPPSSDPSPSPSPRLCSKDDGAPSCVSSSLAAGNAKTAGTRKRKQTTATPPSGKGGTNKKGKRLHLPVQKKKQRKKEQNKVAAMHYRQRKKEEKSDIELRKEALEDANTMLRAKLLRLTEEVEYFKSILPNHTNYC